jgi:hypothetical protein
MNGAEYNSIMQSITKHMEEISKITAIMAQIGIANNNNPDFVAIMGNYDKLDKFMAETIEAHKKFIASQNLM